MNYDHSFCGVSETVKIIGRKWALLILKHLFTGTKRFNELQRMLPGISPRTLSQRLQQMEADGIIHRQSFAEIPPHVEYSLTEKGLTLSGIIRNMREWGEESYKREEALGTEAV
jgi:DNA-binding HxlR family transcriptional regulator